MTGFGVSGFRVTPDGKRQTSIGYGAMSRPVELLVVGAGPTGLALALQARACGAQVRLIDRRGERFRPSRAFTMHTRTFEVLRPLGVTEALLACADTNPRAQIHFGSRVVHATLGALDLRDTPFPHLSLIRQMDVEMVLMRALADRGVAVEWGTELIGAVDHTNCVRATLRTRDGVEEVAADFLVGCDGPDSIVRCLAGIGWRGKPYREEIVLADLELESELTPDTAHVAVGRRGLLFLLSLGERAEWRLLGTRSAEANHQPFGQPGDPVSLDDLQALIDASGMPARIREVAFSANYRVQRRLADRFQHGRFFLAGDAAHGFSPATGQGMNTSIQDAINLGWKLAFAAAATDPAALLASYDHERRSADRRTLAITHVAFWVEASNSWIPTVARGKLGPLASPLLAPLLRRRRLIGEGMSAVTRMRLRYAASPISQEGTQRLDHGPALGARVPDATVSSERSGTRMVRLHELMARPGVHVLLQRDAGRLKDCDFGPQVNLHRLTNQPGQGMIAIRPDGYVGFRAGVADPAQLRGWLHRIGAIDHPSA